MQGKTILVVDDDLDLLRLIEACFSRAGAQVYTAENGREGLRQFLAHRPDLVVLDIMMPSMDGWEVCKELRRLSNVPILLLTALDDNRDIIRGLDEGADDYVTKPFSLDVLLARVRAVLRRGALPPAGEGPLTYDDGYLSVDLKRRLVCVRQKPVRLTAIEYRLLAYLFENSGRVLTNQQLLTQVWGARYDDSPEYVHVYISRLRQKLEADPLHPRYLVTEHGIGYAFRTSPPPEAA